jgi:Zn-finger nucleic acid-binding protein
MATATLTCPTCRTPLATAGRTDRCKTCDGAWVHEDVLVGMLQETASAMVFLPWHPREQDRERGCAVCGAAMQPVSLGTVALDRCTEHGIWFDATELAALIAQAKQFKADPRPREPGDAERDGLLGALARLFGG